jgi:hypothetical protein
VERDIDVGLDDGIYPSLVIATSTIKLYDEEDETVPGNADFDQVVESGMRQFRKHADNLLVEDVEAPGFALIDIHEARLAGRHADTRADTLVEERF